MILMDEEKLIRLRERLHLEILWEKSKWPNSKVFYPTRGDTVKRSYNGRLEPREDE